VAEADPTAEFILHMAFKSCCSHM